MFSLLDGGYKTCQNKVNGIISVQDFIWTIRNHPAIEKINYLRTLPKGESYNIIKGELPAIKIHGIFDKYGSAEHFSKFSGYIYFDVDKCDVNATKNKILDKHSDKISILGTSVGGKGIFFLIKIANPEIITSNNFDNIHENIRTRIFADIPTDKGAMGIYRNFVLPFDTDLYINDSVQYIIKNDFVNEKSLISTMEKHNIQYVEEKKKRVYGLDVMFLPIHSFWESIIWRTPVDVKHAIVEVKNAEYNELRVFKMKDGEKHLNFPRIVFCFRKLNPHFDLDVVLSFMNWVNKIYTCKCPMQTKRLIDVVTFSYYAFDAEKVTTKNKGIWFNENCGWSGTNKSAVSNIINGQKAKIKSKQLMKDVLKQLIVRNEKVTKIKISKMTGLSLPCVSRHWCEVVNDLDEYEVIDVDEIIEKVEERLRNKALESKLNSTNTQVSKSDSNEIKQIEPNKIIRKSRYDEIIRRIEKILAA